MTLLEESVLKILKIAEEMYESTYIRLQLSDSKDTSFFDKSNFLGNLLKLPEKFHSIAMSAPPAVLGWDNGEISIKSTIGGGYGFYSTPSISAEEFLAYLHSQELISNNPFSSDNIATCSY